MSTTFVVDRAESDETYCPYCNCCPSGAMADEHVYPKSIGGSSESVIRVCVDCNSRAGHIVDHFIGKHSWLRGLAFSSGNLMKSQEGHISTGVLKDGKTLTGRVYFAKVGTSEVKVEFKPDKMQADGSKWLNENTRLDEAKLPSDINIYRKEMLDKASITATSPEGASLEPAMVKILLGMSYWARGKQALMMPGFDIFRSCPSPKQKVKQGGYISAML